jgi:hypothetical protein
MFRPDSKTGDATTKPASNMSDGVSDAVHMGYSVIEEQIRQGQRAAQQMRGAAFGTGMESGIKNAKNIANRLLQYSTDLAVLHFDLMSVLLHSTGSDGISTNVAPSQGTGSRVIIEIESKRKNQVTLDLWPGKQTANLTIPALHSAESEKTPLTDVSFVPGTEQAPARLCIAIPDAQPAGVYSGLILDAETSQPGGTLSLRLDE